MESGGRAPVLSDKTFRSIIDTVSRIEPAWLAGGYGTQHCEIAVVCPASGHRPRNTDTSCNEFPGEAKDRGDIIPPPAF
jgi:hypothetical protein